MVYTFNEFEDTGNYKLGLFTKASKYLKVFMEQLYLNAGLTTHELAELSNIPRKKMLKLVELLAEHGYIYCTIRLGETYPILTIKGRELINYLENKK
jgi:DNA-binding transcriptional regulator LsrR (DeoR family)